MPGAIGACLLRCASRKGNGCIAQDVSQRFDRCQSATATVISDYREVAASAEKTGTAYSGINRYCARIHYYNCTVTRVCTGTVGQCYTIRPGLA
ncbi:hypothetical protein D3C72_1993250 [compost metagenome]